MHAPRTINIAAHQCVGKHKFPTLQAAAERAARFNYYQAVLPNDRLDVYRCYFCKNYFHVGHGYYRNPQSIEVVQGVIPPDPYFPAIAYHAQVETNYNSIWRCAWFPAASRKVWARPDIPGSMWQWMYCSEMENLGAPTRPYWLYHLNYV